MTRVQFTFYNHNLFNDLQFTRSIAFIIYPNNRPV